jgi:hypothetical protein
VLGAEAVFFDQMDGELYATPDVCARVATELARSKPAAMIEQLVAHKRSLGQYAWCDYAEGFKTALPLLNQRWGRTTEVGRVLLELAGDAHNPAMPSMDK